MDDLRRLVPTAIRRRYAVKFGIVLLILGLGIGMVGFVATGAITNQVEDRVENDHTSIASQEAQNLQMWNEQNEHTIGVIARSEVVASDEPEPIQQRFLDWEEHLDADTFAISYVDTGEGTVLASTESELRQAPSSEIEGVPNEAYAEAHQMEGVPWVSDAYLEEGEFGQEVAVITYVLSVPDEDDRAIVYTAELEAYANRLDEDEHVTTMVVDGENEIMLDNAGYGEEHETLGLEYGGDADAIIQPARTESAGTHRVEGATLSFDTSAYDFGSENYVVSSARVFGTDWVVVTHEPESQAFGYVNTVDQWGTYATLIGVLMVGLVGAALGRNTAVSIDRLTDKASKMEEGDLDVDLETKRIDNIGRLYQGFDSMRVALRQQIQEAEAAREEAERERERIADINAHLEEKAGEYSDVMEAAADGDLTARMDAESENEAMEEIAEEFNQMLEEIEQTVAELSRFATDVATASEQVTASSEEVRSASQQVTESIQEISDGAERQNESLQSVNQEMSALSTTTEEIAASSNEVADIAEQTVNTGQDGQEAAQQAINAMEQIENEAEDAVDEIRRLEQEVQQIDELIAAISEIARQTNMLALNANIEASRSASGNDDEGFSVVAKEVKALSEDVAEAADEAEDRLEAIRERTELSADEVEGTSAQIEDAGEQVAEAVEALEEIAELAQETNVGVQEISAATEEQAASTQEVVAMVDDAATISEETTSEAENVAAAAEEQTTAMTEVTKSASDLSGQAAELSEALDRFETDTDPGDLELEFDSTDDDDGPGRGVAEFDPEDETVAEEDETQGQGILQQSGDDGSETRTTDTDSQPGAGSTTATENEAQSTAEAFDAEPAPPAPDSVEETSEPTTEPEPTETTADSDPDGSEPAGGDADDEQSALDAGEVLGSDEQQPETNDEFGIADSVTEDSSDDDAGHQWNDPLADDAAQDDPLTEENSEAQPLEPIDDADGDADGADDAESETDAATTQTEPENDDDVFTFGNSE